MAWRTKEIWYAICFAECVFSKVPGNLFGDRHLNFDKDVQNDEVSYSDESEVDANQPAKVLDCSLPATQAKGPTGKTGTNIATSVTPDCW